MRTVAAPHAERRHNLDKLRIFWNAETTLGWTLKISSNYATNYLLMLQKFAKLWFWWTNCWIYYLIYILAAINIHCDTLKISERP